MTNVVKGGADKPSFGAEIKHELAALVPAREDCQVSELKGIVAASPVDASETMITVRVTLNALVRKLVRLAHLRGVPYDQAEDSHYLRGATHIRPTYRVRLPVLEGTPLDQLAQGHQVPPRECCRRAFLRGAFLASGSASLSGAGYHLEFAVPTEDGARVVAGTMEHMALSPRTRPRRGKWIVYLKGSEPISLLLAAMGGSKAVLRFESFRIVRDVRGQANRQTNSETANLRRSVATSLRQAALARALAGAGILDGQPPAIREVASMRIAMPSASLEQLASRLHLSKSAVNQRLRRLVEVASVAGLVD